MIFLLIGVMTPFSNLTTKERATGHGAAALIADRIDFFGRQSLNPQTVTGLGRQVILDVDVQELVGRRTEALAVFLLGANLARTVMSSYLLPAGV